jgi:phosphatidylethanolamine/phosphatidyl-N-methylethanolamine N-methyltransferase
MTPHTTLPHESKIYSQFSHLYDRIFTNIFSPRIFRVVNNLEIPHGSRVLEVGVGTGLSLGAYPPHCQLTGVDLAPNMLARAERKVRWNEWHHVDLEVGDAQALAFPDDYFDYVTSFHVVSVVPDPRAMMREMSRVCRPGGQIVIINHFRSERRLIASLVDRLDPLTRKLGWRTTLRVGELLEEVDLESVQRFKTSPRSLFTVMIGRKPSGPERIRVAS